MIIGSMQHTYHIRNNENKNLIRGGKQMTTSLKDSQHEWVNISAAEMCHALADLSYTVV